MRKPGLRVVARKGSGALYLRGTVAGQSVYESTDTSDPHIAEQIRAKREAELWQRSIYGAKAVVTFAAAAESYLRAEQRSPATAANLLPLIQHFGKMPLARITQEEVDRSYRALLRPASGGATKLRMVLTPLRAVLRHAAIRGWCERPTFETPKVAKPSHVYLYPAQATALVQGAADHLRPLLVFALGTGCRMSEMLDLRWPEVDLRGARARVYQKQGTWREVSLPPVVVAALAALPHREGHVFRPVYHGKVRERYADTGRRMGGQIGTAWATALRRAGLEGFTPHDMRHTWATWHYCVHRDLRGLMDEGGWQTVGMVVRYAKRMPDAYREEVIAWWQGGPGAAERRTA
jgi:integrase